MAIKSEINKKDLVPGQKIAQSSTQEAMFSSPKSTQFPITELNHWKNTINIKNNQIKIIKRLSKIRTDKIEPKEFLRKLKEVFGSNDFEHSTYIENQIKNKKNILRISSHSINSFYARKKIKETSIVIKLSEHDFVDHKDRLVKEYVYFPENLTKEVKDNIINGLSDWVNTGIYTYEKADRINMTSDFEMKEKERNIALIDKETRSQYLEGKTELTDEDIVQILDLPHEKPSNRELPVFTDKAFLELKEYPEELNKLASRLKLEPEYLKYRSTYIAKSKLLFQESRVLYNEIPALMILDEINEPAFLLPYLYSRKGKDEKSFADSILENNNAFTDFKRVFSEDFYRDYKKGKSQGSEVFIFLNHKKFDKQNVFHRLKRKVKASNSKNKTYKAYFYSEQEKELFGYSIDKIGFIKELDITQVKKSGLTPLGKPSGAEAISNKIGTTSTGVNINRVYKFVNNSFFNSLLERGAITELTHNSDIKNRDERYLIALNNLEAVTNGLPDSHLKSSNLSFIQKEKNSQYYKDLIRQKERNVALIDKAYKLTRSEYLENKTELSDEDIVRILDLPAEKEIRTQIKSYTDKDYLELAKDNTKLSQLTESLKNDAEYLTYRGSYIAKSKLLYESPVTLCNEIPSLLIGEEIGESFYLLPYGYAKDKSENFKKFADMLERDNFIDIKRNYSTKLKHNFKKGHNQGNNIFFFITSDKTDYEKIRQEINKCVYNRKEVQNKTAKYIVYIEQSNRCGSFSFDTTGKLVTEKEYTLKQIRSFDNERPLVARGRMQSIPSGTSLILNNNDENVNDLFHSLLLRGELEMIRVHPELHIYSDKYKEACSTLGKITNETHSKLLKSSNLAFLQSEKQTQFYKDLQKGEEKTMENTNEEIINQETENSIKKEAKAIIFTPENADEFAKMANEGNIPLKADEAKKLIEIFQKAGLTLRYEPLPDALVINGKKEVLNVLNYEENMIINIPEVLKLAGIKVEENSQTSDKRVEFSAEEEKEYQEWEEMLDDNQKAEEIIEKNHQREPVSLNPEESLDDNQSEENDNNGQLSKFDSELSEYIAGKLPKNHIFNLGFPGKILQNCGFPKDQRIELSGSHLEFKSKLKRHPFDLGEIKGLDVALQNPLAVFAYGDKTKSQNIIVNIEKEGKNFLTGIHFNQKNRGYEVSDIRTLYPKENIEWLNWINQGKLIYGNKEKLQALIAQQRMNVAEVNSQVVQSPLHEHCLESVENILQKFGDVKEIYTDGYLFYEEIREQSKIEQKFFAYYTEKGNLDARELSTVEADEFYTALKNNDIAKIDEYKKNDLHEISELANEIFLDYTKNNPKIVNKIKKPEQLIYTSTEIGHMEKENANSFTKEATDTIQTVIARNSYALEHSSIREQVGAVIASIPLKTEKSINPTISPTANSRNVALINKTQGEKTMPGEKQIIAEIGFADGEIRQYEDSVPFLKDLNEATRENAYDTNFRVYADSDELKQKAADVKLDNYDPIEAAERMHNGYEWNDVEHEAVQFTQSAEGRRLLKDAENGRLTMLDARDILDAVEKNGMTLRYDPLPNSYVVDGWTAADGEKLDNYVVSMSELKRLAGIEISENSQQNQIKKGNLEYIDEKRSREWAVRQRLQLPPLTDILGYSPNLTTKEDFVNSQKSLSKKRNVAHEEAPTQGDKSMPGEKKELSFSEQVDLVLAGKYNRFDALKVCDTPDLLLQSGLKQLPMLYTQRHLREAIQQKDLHNHTHGIKIEQIKSLPELIKNPVMIYDSLSRSESLLVLTSEIDVDKMPIVVSIRPNGKGTYELKKVDSNFITSMYGRENFEQHINSVVNNGKIIYWNKEKSQALFSVLGQRLPKGLNNLDPYKILHQTNSVVNTQFQTRTTEQETPTIKNNNEKSQERHSDAKDYLIQTTRLFLSKLKEKNLPFLRGKERGPNIIIRPQAARDAATGKAFTGYTQLMAQALIQALYDQKKLPELEYDLITYDQAKACGTFIKKGSPHITLTNYNRTTNSASKQIYYFKSGCNSPEMIDLHKESIARNRAIKRIRQSLENKEIPPERQTEEKNKITLLHYEEMTYLKALNKDTEQYFDSLTAEEKEMLKTLCSKEPLTQKTVRELAETLRKDRLISAQLSSQKNSGRSFDATECIVPEDFIGKAMAAASLGCSLETTQGTIDRITKDLHQTLSRNIEHYDYGKPFETGEIINGKCRNNVKDMCNKEYEAEELAKKIEQQQMALKKNPINALMELLNRNDLSDRTIGGYER